MKRLFLIVFSMFVIFFIFVVPNVCASSVIRDGKAGGYEYTITQKETTYFWKIGHQGNISVIEENENNRIPLINLMTTVNNINSKKFKLILAAAYFLIVVIITIIAYWKLKKMPKLVGIYITLLAGIALYYMVFTIVDLTTLLEDAKFYYLTLTN